MKLTLSRAWHKSIERYFDLDIVFVVKFVYFNYLNGVQSMYNDI